MVQIRSFWCKKEGMSWSCVVNEGSFIGIGWAHIVF